MVIFTPLGRTTCAYNADAFYRTTSASLGGTHQVIKKGAPKGPLFITGAPDRIDSNRL